MLFLHFVLCARIAIFGSIFKCWILFNLTLTYSQFNSKIIVTLNSNLLTFKCYVFSPKNVLSLMTWINVIDMFCIPNRLRNLASSVNLISYGVYRVIQRELAKALFLNGSFYILKAFLKFWLPAYNCSCLNLKLLNGQSADCKTEYIAAVMLEFN